MGGRSIQIQTVLYQNEKSALYRSMDSLQRALEICREAGGELDSAHLVYGDASPSPLFTEEEIRAVQEQYRGAFSFDYLYFGFNSGTSKGHNIMAESCNTDYLQIMNPDIILSPRYFLEILKPFHTEELRVGMVEARQTPVEHPKEYDRETGVTAWGTLACAVCITGLYHELGGLDAESFFMYCDDVDFSWRVRLAGYQVIYQPLAVVYHAKRLSERATWQPTKAEMFYSAEAKLMVAYKYSNPRLVKKLLEEYSKSDDPDLRLIAKEFIKKREQNSLPRPIDSDHRVATFIDGAYARHRFFM